jgi:hypothetical protein
MATLRSFTVLKLVFDHCHRLGTERRFLKPLKVKVGLVSPLTKGDGASTARRIFLNMLIAFVDEESQLEPFREICVPIALKGFVYLKTRSFALVPLGITGNVGCLTLP